MKKSFFTLLLIFFVAGLNAQTTIAIIEFGADNVVSQAECKAIERAFRNGFDFNDYNVVDETLLNTTMRNNRISRASMSDDDLYKLSERLNFQQVLLGDISVLDDGYLSIDIRVLDFNEGPILEDGQKWLRGEGFGNPILDLLRRVREKLSKSTTDFTSANNENKYWAEVLRLERELGWQQSERGALDSEPEEERITLLETAPKGEYKRYTPKNTERANEPSENAVTHSAQQPVKSKTPLGGSTVLVGEEDKFDSLSYALGSNIVYMIKYNIEDADFNYDRIAKGIEDVIDGKSSIEPQKASEIVKLHLDSPREDRFFHSEDQRDMISYALGVDQGNGMISARIPVQFSWLKKALFDVKSGSSLFGESQEAERITKQVVQNWFEIEAPKKFLKESEDFLANILSHRGWTKNRKGLIYRIIQPGNADLKVGDSSDRIKIHYLGKTMSGEIFDSSYDRGMPNDFVVNDILVGMQEALKLIGVGGKILVWLHPDLAYGAQAMSKEIGPNAALYFEVELLEVNGQGVSSKSSLSNMSTSSTEQTAGVSSSRQQSVAEPVSTNQVEVTTATESTAHVLEEVEYRTAYENTGNICYQAGDYATAFTNYVNAAKYGSIQSMSRLGQMYYKGMGVERNVQEAMKWWMLVVDNADAAEYNERKAVGFAANMIGYCYLAGRDGIAQNLDLAQRWAEKALGYGYRDATRLLNEIKKQKEIRGLP